MTDFDFECKEKKRIAQGAFHKKNGAHSKGCHLPHEDLTPAQQKRLNGEVKTLNLDTPRTWAELRGLSREHQILYIDYLTELYHPTQRMLAQMLGVNQCTVQKLLIELGVSTGYVSRGKRPSAACKAMWEAFCNGVVGGQPGESKAEEPAPAPQEVKEELEEKDEPKVFTLHKDKGFEFHVDPLDMNADDSISIQPHAIIAGLTSENAMLKIQLDFYKRLYNELLDKLIDRTQQTA